MKNRLAPHLRAVLIAVLAAATLPACSTVEGMGLDISSGARTVGGWFGR